MWKKVAKFKGAEYFRKALYIYISWCFYSLLSPTIQKWFCFLTGTYFRPSQALLYCMLQVRDRKGKVSHTSTKDSRQLTKK